MNDIIAYNHRLNAEELERYFDYLLAERHRQSYNYIDYPQVLLSRDPATNNFVATGVTTNNIKVVSLFPAKNLHQNTKRIFLDGHRFQELFDNKIISKDTFVTFQHESKQLVTPEEYDKIFEFYDYSRKMDEAEKLIHVKLAFSNFTNILFTRTANILAYSYTADVGVISDTHKVAVIDSIKIYDEKQVNEAIHRIHYPKLFNSIFYIQYDYVKNEITKCDKAQSFGSYAGKLSIKGDTLISVKKKIKDKNEIIVYSKDDRFPHKLYKTRQHDSALSAFYKQQIEDKFVEVAFTFEKNEKEEVIVSKI